MSLLHFDHVLHGDASGTGMFLEMLRNNPVTLVSKPFSEEEAAKSSTFCEVKTNLASFKNASILQYTDSKVAKHILTYGSKNPEI